MFTIVMYNKERVTEHWLVLPSLAAIVPVATANIMVPHAVPNQKHNKSIVYGIAIYLVCYIDIYGSDVLSNYEFFLTSKLIF